MLYIMQNTRRGTYYAIRDYIGLSKQMARSGCSLSHILVCMRAYPFAREKRDCDSFIKFINKLRAAINIGSVFAISAPIIHDQSNIRVVTNIPRSRANDYRT